MKLFIVGAICVWLMCGVTGAVMLGQRGVHMPTIAGGPMTLWKGFNMPLNH